MEEAGETNPATLAVAATQTRPLRAARVAAGELGALRLLHGGYLQDWLSTAEDDSWRVDPALRGGSRGFADIGSHWCDLAEFITGERIAALCAETATVVPERADLGQVAAFAAHDGNG